MKRSDTTPLIFPEAAALSEFKPPSGLLARAWRWLCSRQLARSGSRRLKVAETVSLGEKRFVAVVQVDGRHFLLAGGPANIALLAQLDEKEPFARVLKKTMTVAEKPMQKLKHGKAAVKKKFRVAAKASTEASATAAEIPSAFAEVLSKTIAKPRRSSVRGGEAKAGLKAKSSGQGVHAIPPTVAPPQAQKSEEAVKQGSRTQHAPEKRTSRRQAKQESLKVHLNGSNGTRTTTFDGTGFNLGEYV